MKAAHFLLLPELAGSPPNEAIVSALLDCGYAVDLFAPGGADHDHPYGERVRLHDAEYGRRWLIRHGVGPSWRRYRCFSATCEDPAAAAGWISFLHRRPSFILADEIRSGQYRGNASEPWKRLCRWAMRRSAFQIVNDDSRVALQRAYCGAPEDQPILTYPGCFRAPPAAADRARTRRSWGFGEDALVVGFSGGFSAAVGADWLVSSISHCPDARFVIHPLHVDPMVRVLLDHVEGRERIHVENRRLSWQEAWSQAGCFDIGVCVYHHPAPQFRNMGISSNRLCMFLAMGVPVIATRQPSFEFIERYDCGVLVDNETEFARAIDTIGARLDTMKENAEACTREYIDAPGRYLGLKRAIAALNP